MDIFDLVEMGYSMEVIKQLIEEADKHEEALTVCTLLKLIGEEKQS